MAEPRSETMELATALVALAADLEAGRSATVEPATLRRAGDLLAAKPTDSVPNAAVGFVEWFNNCGVWDRPPSQLARAAWEAALAQQRGAGLAWCALDRDECTVTLAFDAEEQVNEFAATHPSRNRIRVVDQQTTETPEERKAREAREANDGR